jgi:hypothetical protein
VPDIVLSGVSDALITELGKRASEHQCSPVDEAKLILAEALLPPAHKGWEDVDAIYDRLASSGRRFSDSAELIREDRDR